MREEIIELYENHNKIDKIENIIDEILKNINFDMDYNDYKKQRQYYNRDIYNSKYKKIIYVLLEFVIILEEGVHLK